MASSSPLLNELMEALRCLPGVGQKTAQRMAYHLLERDRQGGARLAKTLVDAIDGIGHCEKCRSFSEDSVCSICASPRRDVTKVCVIESPAEVQVLEQATGFNGLYFVLMGRLSPLDGIGPSELGLDKLAARFDSGEVQEVILATNPTVEGEATAYYISEMAKKRDVQATRIAHGVPLGGELEYIDDVTLSHAFSGRKSLG